MYALPCGLAFFKRIHLYMVLDGKIFTIVFQCTVITPPSENYSLYVCRVHRGRLFTVTRDISHVPSRDDHQISRNVPGETRVPPKRLKGTQIMRWKLEASQNYVTVVNKKLKTAGAV